MMTVLNSKTLPVVLILAICSDIVIGRNFVYVTRTRWGGTFALFPVPRERVETKLSEMIEGNSCIEGFLTLPNRPILTEFLRENEHVVGITIGYIWASSFINTLSNNVSYRYSLKAPTVQFFIPFLTGPNPDGPPQYKVVLNSFVSTDKPFIQPNVAVPTTQVEELVLGENGLFMKNGVEYFNVSWSENETCKHLNYIVTDDVDEFLEELIVPYNYQLNVSACDGFDVQEVDLCKSHDEFACTLLQNRFNACAYWTLSDPLELLKMCGLQSFSVDAISEAFQAVSLLSEDNRIPIISEIHNAADVDEHIKVPCIELTQRFKKGL